MNEKDIISVLSNIESNVDVNSLTYKGCCVWPYLRNQIATYLTHADHGYFSQLTIDNRIHIKLISTIKQLARYTRELIKNWNCQRLEESDVIFLARTSERNNLVKGKWYNHHCDSFSDLFEEIFTIQLLEFNDSGVLPGPPVRSSYYLDFHLLINHEDIIRL